MRGAALGCAVACATASGVRAMPGERGSAGSVAYVSVGPQPPLPPPPLPSKPCASGSTAAGALVWRLAPGGGGANVKDEERGLPDGAVDEDEDEDENADAAAGALRAWCACAEEADDDSTTPEKGAVRFEAGAGDGAC